MYRENQASTINAKEQLSVISELSIESLDSDDAVQQELKKMGITDLKTKNRPKRAVENELIDKLNAKAVQDLNSRQRVAVVQEKISEVFN